MNTDKRRSRIGAATLACSLLFGVGIILATTAQAQYPSDRYPQNNRDRNLDQYGNYGGSAQLRQTALTTGYNDGIREASQNNRQANYQSSYAYRRATNGYTSRLGDRELYKRYFREGFENGYNQNNQSRDNGYRNRDNNNNGNQDRHGGRNWDGYGNFGGSYELRQTALNAGFNEGVKVGRSDRNKRNRSDYRNESNYRRATQDYSSKLGDRELYQRYYRDAFGHGYDDGIAGN